MVRLRILVDWESNQDSFQGDREIWRGKDIKPIHIAPLHEAAATIRPSWGYMASVMPQREMMLGGDQSEMT